MITNEHNRRNKVTTVANMNMTLLFLALICLIVIASNISSFTYVLCMYQKMRSVRWPQDLDKKMKVVELYVVNDYSQVSILLSLDYSSLFFVDVY